MKALHAEQLDHMGCSTPGCEHTTHDAGMWVHSDCHPDEPLRAMYVDGEIRLSCALCEAPVAKISVAP